MKILYLLHFELPRATALSEANVRNTKMAIKNSKA